MVRDHGSRRGGGSSRLRIDGILMAWQRRIGYGSQARLASVLVCIDRNRLHCMCTPPERVLLPLPGFVNSMPCASTAWGNSKLDPGRTRDDMAREGS